MQIFLPAYRLVDFVMGLNKLRTLSITRARQCGERDCQVGMCKLQGHLALGEICLDFYEEEDARLPWYREEDTLDFPLTKSLCSFFAMPQLKVLSLIIGIPQAEVIQRFLAIASLRILCCSQKAKASQYIAARELLSQRNNAL